MMAAAKGLVEKAAVKGGLVWMARALTPESVVLAYHNVVPDGLAPAGDIGLHLEHSRFAAQLDQLEQRFHVVTLRQALECAEADGKRPRVAITFDDAYRGAVTVAVEELRRREMPATIFVAPGLLGRDSFWWDALAESDGGLEDDLRDHALTRLEGRDHEIRRWAMSTARSPTSVPEELRPATESELARAAQVEGITIGSHTWSHPDLTRVSDESLADELTRPLTWLRNRLGSSCFCLAYPYGRHDDRVRRATARAGYRTAVALESGSRLFTARNDFAVPRINIAPGLSPEGFLLRISGLVR